MIVLFFFVALACEPLPCSGTVTVPAHGTTVPENLTHAEVGGSGVDQVPFVLGGQTLEPAYALNVYTLTLGDLKPGEITLTGGPTCISGPGGTPRTWTVGEPAPAPTALGTLSTKGPKRGKLVVGTDLGSCSTVIDAMYADVTVSLHATAAPWEHAWVYETWVDGERYRVSGSLSEPVPHGGSWVGRGVDRIYTQCKGSGFDGVSEGTHQVVFHARLPGSAEHFETPALSITLTCPPVRPTAPAAPKGRFCATGGASAGGFSMLLLLLQRRRRNTTSPISMTKAD